MNGVLQGISEDVRFNHAAAASLATGCRNAATAIDGQTGPRATWVSHGLEDFVGYYADLFRQNGTTQAGDASRLAAGLRDVATKVDYLAGSATAEQNRRETARAWKRRQDERGFWDHVSDWFTGGEAPPVGGPDPATPQAVPAPAPPQREPLTGSGSTGTSSARPANLRSFASNSSGANQELAHWPGSLRGHYDTFVAGCGWGSLDASGVLTAFTQYLTANGQDVQWANTVAGAFEAAGSSGVVTMNNASITASLQASGVNPERADLVIAPPEAYGSPPTTGYAMDPVNTATGNFLEPETDLAFGGGCSSLQFTRMYNSLHTGVGAFGPGWSSWTEAGLILGDADARWVREDGRHIVFPRQGEGWDRATTEAFWLGRDGDGFTITDNTGARWRFDAAGRLVETGNGPGTRVSMHWDGTRLLGLVHERGRSVTLDWADDRVRAAVASDGRRVDYAYDEAGRLVAATSHRGTRRYAWNEAGLIQEVTDGDGVRELANTYDGLGRVVEQVSPHGRLTRFSYLPGNITMVADPDGTRSNTWIHDTRARLVGIVDADDQRVSLARDAYGNIVMATERDGSVTVSEYDERSRLTARVTPAGARIETVWDHEDRIGSVTVDADGRPATTSFHYRDGERNPHTITDAEGGATTFEWSQGLLTATTDPMGVRFTLRHDEHGDIVAFADGDGNEATLERDEAGRIVASTTPLGHRSTFSWTGELLTSRTDPDGSTWRFEHTPAGRIAAIINPLGARTAYEHGDAGDTTRVTDPVGRTTHRVFDVLGNLAGIELPDGSRWEFTHDNLSRLVATLDPEGGEWRAEYDVNGRVSRSIDPTGRETVVTRSADHLTVRTGSARADGPQSTLVTDRIGRIVSLSRPGQGNLLTRYDLAGRPVEYVDAEGHVTTLTRDAAGRVVHLARPDGSTMSYTYDNRGKLASVTDGTGATTTFTFDADSRLVAETGPTGDAITYDYDENGRVVAQFRPGEGRTAWTYDAAGRVIATRSRLWGTRRFTYDAADQLVEARDALGGVTRFAYDALGRSVEVTDPLGNTVRRVFNGRDQLIEETDALGRILRIGHDAAGRLAWYESPTGDRTAWEYDADGALAGVTANGRTVARHARDFTTNTLTIDDRTATDHPVTHHLRWDARGQLVERARDGAAVRWAWDAVGRCASVTAPDGATTRYTYDAAGRRTAIETTGAVRVDISVDPAGRVVGTTTDGLTQSWVYAGGEVVAHTLQRDGQVTQTHVERDSEGRITAIVRDGERTAYEHDAGGQLLAALGAGGDHRWAYDPAGRLVAESSPHGEVTYSYDAAGQLVRRDADGATTTFTYDAAGRRTGEEGPAGRLTFRWNELGWLAEVAGPRGRTSLHVDALGELARVDDADVFWNMAERGVAPVQVGGESIAAAPGLLARDGVWQPTGWRAHRGDGVDPWTAATATALPGGIHLGASGQVSFAGLEWLGERVHDPASRGFLSRDPLDAIAGAPWAGSPYSYAGNDPLHAVDPTGLSPVTDEELAAYTHAHHTGSFWERNGSQVIGGLLVVGGAAAFFLIPPPAGQMIGGAALSAGVNTLQQSIANPGQPIDWREVVINGALGAIPVGQAATLAGAFGKGALQGAAAGAITSGYTNWRDGVTGWDAVQNMMASMAQGAAMGGILNGGGHAWANRAPSTGTTPPATPAPSPELTPIPPTGSSPQLALPPGPSATPLPALPPGPSATPQLALLPGPPPPLALPPGPPSPLALPPGSPSLVLPAPPPGFSTGPSGLYIPNAPAGTTVSPGGLYVPAG